jgi:flagellar FliJ protein
MKKRSERMAPVQRVLGSAEKERARDFGSAQREKEEAEKRLKDLQQYHDEYLLGFEQRARTGQSASALRDYQLFLARLKDAIKQQEQVVQQSCEAVAGSRQRWQSAARQVKAVDSVVDRWQGDERRLADRLDQKDSDEHAQQRRHAQSRTTPEGR